MMDSQYWTRWIETFHHGPLTSPMLTLLESGGAFRSLIAQGMLAVTPFINASAGSWKAFAEMLEDPDAARNFADHLREVAS